jgi:mono/diheme cytochrome c family protein
MRTRLAIAVALAACAGPRPREPSGELAFQVSGRVEQGPYKFGVDDLPKLPRGAFFAVPPQRGTKARFEGVAIGDVLTREVEVLRDADVMLVHGHGGLAVVVPLAAVRQYRPVLADHVDGAPTPSWNADAGKLLLAWPNLDQPGFDTDPRVRWWWVPGVVKVELVNWLPTYGRALRVPPGAGDDARLGAEVLQGSCLVCHKVRGIGGTRSRDLKDELVRKDPEAFTAMLHDHLRKASGIPSAPEVTPAQARGVAAFLRALDIAGAGRVEDEIKELPPLPPPGRPGSPRPPGT